MSRAKGDGVMFVDTKRLLPGAVAIREARAVGRRPSRTLSTRGCGSVWIGYTLSTRRYPLFTAASDVNSTICFGIGCRRASLDPAESRTVSARNCVLFGVPNCRRFRVRSDSPSPRSWEQERTQRDARIPRRDDEL